VFVGLKRKKKEKEKRKRGRRRRKRDNFLVPHPVDVPSLHTL
jgi:hypothetical protein